MKDHLGNGWVYFSDMNKDGIVEVAQNGNPNELLQQEHYYPFGMGIKGEWKFVQPQIGGVNAYQYNGKELNEDYDLNWNDYGARWYDASIGRWNGVDPLAEDYMNWSGYNYVLGNPLKFIDPDGRVVLPVIPLVVGAIVRVAVQNAPRVYRAYKAYQSAKAMVSTVQTLTAADAATSITYGTYSYSELTVTPKGTETAPGGFATHEGAVGTPEGMQGAAESGTIPSMEGAAEVAPNIIGIPSVAEEAAGDAIMSMDENWEKKALGLFKKGKKQKALDYLNEQEKAYEQESDNLFKQAKENKRSLEEQGYSKEDIKSLEEVFVEPSREQGWVTKGISRAIGRLKEKFKK